MVSVSASSLADALEALQTSNQAVADEVAALQAIFGDDKISLLPLSGRDSTWQPGQILRLQLETTLPSYEDVVAVFIVSLPPSYPESSPPQLQLSGKYIGDFAIDSGLFGNITRIYMREDAWHEGEVALFEGIEQARELCERFVQVHRDELAAKEAANPHQTQEDVENARLSPNHAAKSSTQSSHIRTQTSVVVTLPEDCKLFTSEPIVDRKSVFVGHACKLKHPDEVRQVVAYLLNDKKIAKAAHPCMLAYRCRGVNDVLHQDNDDDGETAAGSRLAHLLQILDVENVLVVVTRWFGGIHLGSDRFKHINQAARDALLVGGLIMTSNNSKK